MENKKLEEKFPQIKKNVSLKKYTTFKIGGKTSYFLEIKEEKKLIEILKFLKKEKIPFFILGGGSNVLFSDRGFKGVVIRFKNSQIEFKKNKIKVSAGCFLKNLVSFCIEKELSGLEFLAGIPGTLGGAVRGNCGAFGNSIGDFVEEVKVFDFKKMKIVYFSKQKCNFSYRESIFKKNKNLIILKVTLSLKKGRKEEIKRKIKEYLKYRKERQPLDYPSAGSIFKNFIGKIKDKKLIKKYPELKNFNLKKTIPAGYLIEKCNLKGKRKGGAEISKKHANFIINLGKAKAKDVIYLINLAKKKVKEKFKTDLKEEIEIVNLDTNF